MSRIVFDCERMKYEDTGIYHYCLNLGTEIRNSLGRTGGELSFYTPKNAEPFFKDQVLPQRSRHKLWMPHIPDCRVWHSTYQHTDYLPLLHKTVRVLLTIHDLNFMYDEVIPDEKKAKYLNNLQKRIDRSDAIVCISEYCRKDVITFCNTNQKPVYMIHNGANTLQKPRLTDTSYKPKRPFLFSIGAIRRKKNFHSLLPLIKKNLHLDLILAGRPEDKDYLHDLNHLAKEEGLQDNFHFVGQVSESEKSWYYHHCKAFLFPSLAEGFGFPLIEAMSVGKPVFLSDKTALPEIGGNAAFYFTGFSGEHMQESFIKGMDLYEQNNMTELIKKRSGHFSWELAAKQYITIYDYLSNT